MKRKLILDLF